MPSHLKITGSSAADRLGTRRLMLAAAITLLSMAAMNNQPACALTAPSSGIANAHPAATAANARPAATAANAIPAAAAANVHGARKATAILVQAAQRVSTDNERVHDTSTQQGRARGRGTVYSAAGLLMLLAGLTHALGHRSLPVARARRTAAAL